MTAKLRAQLDQLALELARKVCSGYLSERDRVKVLKAALTKAIQLAKKAENR
jgi:hypothetical protein